MRSVSEEFLERIRLRGELAKAAIGEAVNASAQRSARRHQHPMQNVIDETLGSLRVLQQEIEQAIRRVQSLTEEWEHHGQDDIDVIVIDRPADAGRTESVRADDHS